MRILRVLLPVLALALSPAALAQQLLYVHADHLNTPRLVTNGSATPVWRWDQTEPFGDNPPDEDPDGNSTLGHMPLRFPGQYFDKETNLAYNYYRDYDAGIGRYVQSDPIGLAGGLNTYAYVGGKPLQHSDRSGLQASMILNPIVWGPPLIIAGTWIANNPEAAKALKDLLCRPDDEKARCQEVLKTCREKCLDIFVNNPNGLPGSGTDYAGRQRRCIRECMEENKCYDF